MNRDPFLRLALIALCTVYSVGLILLGIWLDPWAAVTAVVGGSWGALALTLEPSAKKPDTDRRRRFRQPAEGTRGFERIE